MSDLLIWLRAEWDRITGGVLIAAGVVATVVTYQRVADTPFVPKQLSLLASGGIGGLLAVAVGVMLRIEADARDEWHKLDRIELALTNELELSSPSEAAEAEPAGPAEERSSRALAFGAAGIVLSVVLLIVGYERAAGTGDIDRAFGGLTLSTAGLAIAGIAVGGYHVLSRRLIGLRKSSLLGRWAGTSVARSADQDPVDATTLAVVPGSTRYHLRTCPSLQFGRPRLLHRTEVDAALHPCQICQAP